MGAQPPYLLLPAPRFPLCSSFLSFPSRLIKAEFVSSNDKQAHPSPAILSSLEGVL